jgi:GTP pyrophosphokinase
MPMTTEQRAAFSADFEAALAFATRLHANQARKGTDIPYISHLIAVAGLVLEAGGDRDEAIGALLHDSIEDQGEDFPGGANALRHELHAKFGQRVLDIVNGCTDADTYPKPPWRARKEAYIGALRKKSHSVRLVSCADKLHNARAIVADLRVVGNALWGRFNGGKEGTLWYYSELAKAFSEPPSPPLAAELKRTVEDMHRLANAD